MEIYSGSGCAKYFENQQHFFHVSDDAILRLPVISTMATESSRSSKTLSHSQLNETTKLVLKKAISLADSSSDESGLIIEPICRFPLREEDLTIRRIPAGGPLTIFADSQLFWDGCSDVLNFVQHLPLSKFA